MTLRDLVILGSSSQQPTRYRNHGAYLLRWNDEGFLIDPGEGTQRQFIFANIPPTQVTRILISHFHGDHCLGVGSFLMRLNLDRITHPVHCYYPASGKKYFHRLRFGTIYREHIEVVEHPIEEEGIVHEDEKFRITARYLDHGVDNLGWRIEERDERKFLPEQLKEHQIIGQMMPKLIEEGSLLINGKRVTIEEVSYLRKGEAFASILDTRVCDNALRLAENCRLALIESTYLEEEKTLAYEHFHMTAKQAATIARDAKTKMLILTHFSARYLKLDGFQKEAREIFPPTFLAEDFKFFPFPKNPPKKST